MSEETEEQLLKDLEPLNMDSLIPEEDNPNDLEEYLQVCRVLTLLCCSISF